MPVYLHLGRMESHQQGEKSMNWLSQRLLTAISVLALLLGPLGNLSAVTVKADHTPEPASVAVVGSLQSELGCSGDWDPGCAATSLTREASDGVWQGTWTVPAGDWEYKVALNGNWDENYGLGGQQGGSNIALHLDSSQAVKFYYSHESHWITSSANSVIAVVPGNFQSELGCPGDWQPDCLLSWLQDADGDGIYVFETTAIPAGNYEGKVALNESWDVNYGQDGTPGGANIGFTVPANGAPVTFRYDSASHVLTIFSGGHYPDNNVEWNGLRHDSRDLLYRTPGGAVPAGSPVKIRFRTFHNDVTAVNLRVYDVNAGAQQIYPMQIAAADVSCYQDDLAAETCDFWEAVLPNSVPDNLWYRFIVSDGSKTVYYADNTPALDGGLGAPSEDVRDYSYALMVYDPAFVSPDWAKDAIIYQIFPDRFRNGNTRNDPQTGMARYDDPVIKLNWGTLPEGYCRNYFDGSTNCPWRFDTTPPDDSLTKESPRGRDYYGGDLRGVIQKLDYLKDLGVTVIYFNPIFDAQSNHRYDTANYHAVDPNLGTNKEFNELVTEANKRGIRIVLDGVFNHMSSDSPNFDRYNHYTQTGACEAGNSLWRSWFSFSDSAVGPCAPSAPGGTNTTYSGWFGFDSIPVINKSNPDVQKYFITGTGSVTRAWLKKGADGWRLDVMGDSSFPDGYWESFRKMVKFIDPGAVIIGELWQKDSTLLRYLRGDRADTTMNYRLRDAVIGLLAPSNFDSKGFADSGRQITPAEFAARIESIREDYPDAAYYSLMNLLDSHDTERLLWTLTPGNETTADKELNAANVAEGKHRMRLASVLQFTMPGAPTIYYGDEVGVTGDDDPDDRRTYPWEDTGGVIDSDLLAHYQTLSNIRKELPVMANGDLRILFTSDDPRLLAYGRKNGQQAVVVAANLSSADQAIDIPVGGYLPEGVVLVGKYGVGVDAGPVSAAVSGGVLHVELPAMSSIILATGDEDLTAPTSPTGLVVTGEGSGKVSLAWNAVADAAGYNVYRSPLSGGGWVKANTDPVTGLGFEDSGLRNAQKVFYIVKSVDAAGNESAPSNEVSALPHMVIGWANLQWPPTMTHTISVTNRTGMVYGQVWIDGVTSAPGATESLAAQLGYGPAGSSPDGNADWNWIDAAFNVDAGNNDEFMASLLPESVGSFDYAFRYSTMGGSSWVYADLDGIQNGYDPNQAGKLTVVSSGDEEAPATPGGLIVTAASPSGIELAWDAVSGDPTLYGYEVRRSDVSGGPYMNLALVTGTSYVDSAVTQGSTYYYVVRAVDQSFNRSGDSAQVSAVAQLRTVSVTFTVTVPASTDGTGRSVYIAGTLDRLDGGLPQWNPGGVVLTRIDATHWSVTLTGIETTQIEYKYALGDWDHVEKDGVCGEISNRILSLTYGSDGNQAVNDTILNWRNTAPCGN